MVEQQAGEAKTLESLPRSLKIYTLAADFFWKKDEPTARKYFSEAFELADSRFKEKGFETKKSPQNFSYSDKDYRFEVISSIGKYDTAWAKKLTDRVLSDFEKDDKSTRKEYEKDKEVGEILVFAINLYDQNPQFALSQLRSAMKYSLVNEWQWVLSELSKKNQSHADEIYSQLLLSHSSSSISELHNLSDYPFGTGIINSIGSNSSNVIPKSFIPNSILQEQFLNLILRRATTFEPNTIDTPKESWKVPDVAYLFHALRTFEPVVQQKFPAKSDNWNTAKTQIYGYLTQKSIDRIAQTDSWQAEFHLPFAKQIEKVEKADSIGELTDNLVYQLITKARKLEDYSKAETWLEKIKDSKFRETVSLLFYFNRSGQAISEKKLIDARKFAAKISDIGFRAIQLLKIADEKLKEKVGKTETTEILFEVYQTALKADTSVAKAQVLFGLAYVYEKVDHQNALNSFSDGIQVINGLENSENVFSNNLVILISRENFNSMTSIDSPGLNLEKVITELSKNDFTNTLNFANSFTDKYYRALSVIAIAKNCKEVAKPVEKVVKTKP